MKEGIGKVVKFPGGNAFYALSIEPLLYFPPLSSCPGKSVPASTAPVTRQDHLGPGNPVTLNEVWKGSGSRGNVWHLCVRCYWTEYAVLLLLEKLPYRGSKIPKTTVKWEHNDTAAAECVVAPRRPCTVPRARGCTHARPVSPVEKP